MVKTSRTKNLINFVQSHTLGVSRVELVEEIKRVFSTNTPRWYSSFGEPKAIEVVIDYYVKKHIFLIEGDLIKVNPNKPSKEPEISIGIEFEGNVITPEGKQVELSQSHYKNDIIQGFERRYDGTTTFEIITPPFVDINSLSNKLSMQWTKFISENNGLIPFFRCGYFHDSIGHHCHIGLPNRKLKTSEKQLISENIVNLIPLFISISGNSFNRKTKVFDTRLARGSYSPALDSSTISNSHYADISNNPIGTVEMRVCDANIPQISTTVCALLQLAARRAFNKPCGGPAYSLEKYKKDREQAIKKGVTGLDLIELKNLILEKCGDIDFTKYPECVKDLVFLLFKYKLSAQDISKSFKKVDYYYTNSTNCHKYINNLINLKTTKKMTKFLAKAKEELTSINKFSDISLEKTHLEDDRLIDKFYFGLSHKQTITQITQSLNSSYIYNLTLFKKIETLLLAENVKEIKTLDFTDKEMFYKFNPNLRTLILNETQKAIKTSSSILRIREASEQLGTNIARLIVNIYAQNGNEQTEGMILATTDRYYTLIANKEVIAFVRINYKDKKVTDLKIDTNYTDYKTIIIKHFTMFLKTKLNIIYKEKTECVA